MELLGTVWILLKDLAGIETRGIEEKQREGGGGVGESVKTQTLIEREEVILGTQVVFWFCFQTQKRK